MKPTTYPGHSAAHLLRTLVEYLSGLSLASIWTLAVVLASLTGLVAWVAVDPDWDTFATTHPFEAGEAHAGPPYRIDTAASSSGPHIPVAVAEERMLCQSISANGIILYDQTRRAKVSARVSGTVLRIEKQVGQPVRQGDVLALIDSTEVGQAKSKFLKARVQCELKSKQLDRLKSIAAVVPDRQMREAEAAVREARIRLGCAQQTLVNLGLIVHSSDLLNLDDASAHSLHFLGIPEAVRSSLDPASTTANLFPLVAPLDGVVIGRQLAVGELVSPEQAQFVVADLSRMWIVMDVRKEDANRIDLGQPLVFLVEGTGREVRGRISWISTELDPKTRTLQARADVENPQVEDPHQESHGQRLLAANAFGTGLIFVREAPAAPGAPGEAEPVRIAGETLP